MKHKRLLFQLVPSVPLTGEIEYGLLPAILRTPSASDGEGGIMEIRTNAHARYKLRDQVPHFAKILPTPTANTAKNLSEGINFDKREEKGHLDGVFMNQIGKRTGLKLQPAFVEWMMGYPIGWTDCEH
jgi:hypothetical protein